MTSWHTLSESIKTHFLAIVMNPPFPDVQEESGESKAGLENPWPF